MRKSDKPDKGFLGELASKPKVAKEATSVVDHYQNRRTKPEGPDNTMRRLREQTAVAKPKASARLDQQYEAYLKKRRGEA